MLERVSRNFRVMALFSLLDKAQERGDIGEYYIKISAYEVNVRLTNAIPAVISHIQGILPDGRWVNLQEYVYGW